MQFLPICVGYIQAEVVAHKPVHVHQFHYCVLCEKNLQTGVSGWERHQSSKNHVRLERAQQAAIDAILRYFQVADQEAGQGPDLTDELPGRSRAYSEGRFTYF